jgi:FtsH-binding integral membrane protein
VKPAVVSTPFAHRQDAARVDARAIFARTMGLVALTCGCAALGAYLGRDLTGLSFLLPWLGALGCLIGLNVAVARDAEGVAVLLLFGVGLLLGMSIGATVASFADTQPRVLWQAAGATGLTVAGLGAFGYATRRDLSFLYRFLFFALLALIVFGIVRIFVDMPGTDTIYALAGIAIFSGYTVVDFNRLRRAGRREVVPLAAGIFLDVLNLFLFFLQLFGASRD